MLELVKSNEVENKPKNVEEAIKAGWKTAKEIYEAAGVCRDTFNEFMSVVRKCEGLNEKRITGEHNTKYYHPKVEKAFLLWLERNQANQGRSSQLVKQAVHNSVENNEYKYTKEEICSICNVGHAAFERFAPSSISERDFIVVGSNHKKLYTETALQQFQVWLMKNQANQGRASQIVKQATMDNLQVGLSLQEIIKSGNIEAIDEYISIVRNATLAEHNYKLEQAKNQQLEHALEYDQVKDWTPWNKLKSQWKQHFEMLRHKINYTELFDEVGLVEDKHYKKKVLGFDKFPTVLISPEAEDILWDWLDSHN